MISINNYLHRKELKDLIRRWMYNEVHPVDADQVTRLINFNHLYVARYLDQFSEKIFRELYPPVLKRQTVSKKGELKDALVSHPHYINKRIDELILNYRRNPGYFYCETPFYGSLFFTKHDGIDQYIGSSRIKRVRRLSEKVARRITDHLYNTIIKSSTPGENTRNHRICLTSEQMVTLSEEIHDGFLEAENRLFKDLQHKMPIQDSEEVKINDVAGIKIILEEPQRERLMTLLRQMPACTVIEEEHHTGIYNATNLIVCYSPDKERIISQPLKGKILTTMQMRGIHADQLQQAFSEFVNTGEKSIVLEIIVSNYQETLESEIGCCIHEERIIKQRLNKKYRGHLSKNIEYLMEYLFSLPASSQHELHALPIKLWNRYLPDYFDEVLKDLFHIQSYGLLDEMIS